MITELKAMIVVLALSTMSFWLVKPIALRFIHEQDFRRRRNIWLILTATAFLSPTFWWFLPVAVPLLLWAARKDSHPLALYLLIMNVVPSVDVVIPAIGFNRLFDIDIFRLASLCILLPTALRVRKRARGESWEGYRLMDLMLLGYGALQVALFVPPYLPSDVVLHDSFTNVLRRAFLFGIDAYVLYYVASRASTSRTAILDALATFYLAGCTMASVAVFESLRHWLLYTNLALRWGGSPLDSEYITRSGIIRAQASSGHPLALGYLLAISFGISLYIRPQVRQSLRTWAPTALILLGLLFSFARGPWLGAIAIYFAYSALGPRGTSGLLKSLFVFLLAAGMTLASPLGPRIMNAMPFLDRYGDASSVIYRERLFDRSWQLIQAHPLFGDQHAFSHMLGLIQGQGIIDVVNTYVGVTLFYGILGLALFLGFILLALLKAYLVSKRCYPSSPDWALLGALLTACISGTLLMLADCGFMFGYISTFYILAGLAAAYSRQADTNQLRAATETSRSISSGSV